MLTWKSTHAPASVQVILIVSEQTENKDSWASLLQQKGYATVQETPENAIQTCKVVAPALTVIDAQLSHEERLSLCAQLRNITTEPILMLVSDGKGSQVIDLYNIGVDECLLKPISPAFLVVKATSWLLKRRWMIYDAPNPPVFNRP